MLRPARLAMTLRRRLKPWQTSRFVGFRSATVRIVSSESSDFADAAMRDPEPSNVTETFAEICQATGLHRQAPALA